MRQSDITAIRERLEGLPQRKRRKIRGLKAERVDIILSGAMPSRRPWSSVDT